MSSEAGKRVCFCLQAKRDRITKYKARHPAVWPERLEALSRTGWHNHSLFIGEDSLLIGYLETNDFDLALKQMAATEINRKWQNEMAERFDDVKGAHTDE